MAENRVSFDDGEYHASTLGHFIGLLVDAGQDPAVIFRVVKDGKTDDNGAFIRQIECFLIPNGQVAEMIATLEPETIHKTLAMLIEKEVVK